MDTVRTEALETAAEPAPMVIRLAPASPEAAIAYGVIAAVVAWRAWAALQWTFQGDDWAWVSEASRTPFVKFALMQYHGHLQPAQFALIWMATRLAPLNYLLVQLPLFVGAFAAGVLMWKFLGALFGERPANLIPLAVFMLCPLTVQPSLWLAAALITIPLQLFIVATLFAALRYVRRPSPRRLAAVGAAFGGGLLFTEKAVLILPLTALFVLLFLGEGTGRARLRHLLVERWRLWAVLGGITAPYVAWYVSAASWQFGERPPAAQILALGKKTLGSAVVPTFLGGPWRASPIRGVIDQLSDGPRLATWLVVAGIVVVSVVTYRQAWRAWLLPLVYLGMSVELVAAGRLRFVGYIIGLASRYYADVVPVLALALALAFMVPLERREDPRWARQELVIEFGPPKEARPVRLLSARNLALLVVVAYAASAMLTGVRMAGQSKDFSAKTWVATAASQLQSHPVAAVVDTYLPPDAIQAALFREAAKASQALAPIAPGVRWNGADERLLMFDRDGRLWPAAISPISSGNPGPVPGCGYLVFRSPVTIDLLHPLIGWTWGVKVAYYTGQEASGEVSVDGRRHPVVFLRGAHALLVVQNGTARSVTVEGGGNPVCVAAVRVGYLRPLVPARPGP